MFYLIGNPINWEIRNSDKYPINDRRKNRNIRCLNCRERGHYGNECPLPRTAKRCYMCGQDGHYEPRCPNTVCLSVNTNLI